MDADSLPPKMWHIIFSYLNQHDLYSASQVSKKWDEMAFDPRLWKKIIFGVEFKKPTDIIKILRRCHLVTDITFHRVRNFSWINSSPNLKYLRKLEFDWYFCKVDIETLIKRFPLIEWIKIPGDVGENYKMLLDLITKWKFLKHVHLELGNICYEFGHLFNLITDYARQNYKQISELDFTFEHGLYAEEISDIILEKTTTISLNCAGYKCDHFENLSKFSKLSSLHIFDIWIYDDDQLIPLKTLTSLEELCIEQRYISDFDYCFSCYQHLFSGVKFFKMASLRFNQCIINDEDIVLVCESCPNLKYLEFSRCDSITENSFVTIGTKCRNLENLSLVRLKKLKSEVVEKIPRLLSNLKNLFIDRCPKISEDFILKLKQENRNISFVDKRIVDLMIRENTLKIRF